MKFFYLILIFFLNILTANELKAPISFINIGGHFLVDDSKSYIRDQKLSVYENYVALYDDSEFLLSFWDIKQGTMLWSRPIKDVDVGISIQDGGKKIIALGAQQIIIINSENGEIEEKISTPNNIARISADQKYFLMQNGVEKYELYDIKSLKFIQSLNYYSGVIPNFIVSNDKKNIFFFNNQPAKNDEIRNNIEKYPDYFIKGYSIGDGEPIKNHYIRHRTGVTSLVLTSDGKKIISTDLDGKTFVWDAITGKYIFMLYSKSARIVNLSITQDNKTIIGSTQKGQFFIWNLEDGSLQTETEKVLSDLSLGTHLLTDQSNIISNYQSGFRLLKMNSFTYLRFMAFNQNEWIIIDSNGYFTGSRNCAKYLYKTNDNNEVLLIDENDFNQFYRKNLTSDNMKGEK